MAAGVLPATKAIGSPKLERNKRRDANNDRKLRKMGWRVIVVWECRCKTQKGLAREIDRIERLLRAKQF